MRTTNAESPEQHKMNLKGQRVIMLLISFITVLMVALGLILEKINTPEWISITNASGAASVYLLIIYYRYVSVPEKQKQLKAIVDSFANFLALIAIALTFVSVIVTGQATSLYTELASDIGASIIFGVIFGVLFSRVLFPFWDIYSRYRKV